MKQLSFHPQVSPNWVKKCVSSLARTSQSLLCCPKLMCGDMAWTEGSTFSFLLTPHTENTKQLYKRIRKLRPLHSFTVSNYCLLKNGIYALCNTFWQSFNKQNCTLVPIPQYPWQLFFQIVSYTIQAYKFFLCNIKQFNCSTIRKIKSFILAESWINL